MKRVRQAKRIQKVDAYIEMKDKTNCDSKKNYPLSVDTRRNSISNETLYEQEYPVKGHK